MNKRKTISQKTIKKCSKGVIIISLISLWSRPAVKPKRLV